MANVFDKLIERAKQIQRRIILTESEDNRVLEAAGKAADMGLCKVILLGNKDELSGRYTENMLKNIEFIDINSMFLF